MPRRFPSSSRGLSKGERLQQVGGALSDFGEILGNYAYTQMMMKKEQDESKRKELQMELDKRKAEIEVGLSLLPGMRAVGATYQQQAMVGQMLGLPSQPIGVEGPTAESQAIPGILPPEKKAEWEGDLSYNSALMKSLGEHFVPKSLASAPELAAEMVETRKTKSAKDIATAQAQSWEKAKVSEAKELRAMEEKWATDAADAMGLTGKDWANWIYAKKLPKDLTKKEALELGLKYKSYAGLLNENLSYIIDARNANLMRAGKDPSKDEALNAMRLQKLQLDNGVMDGIPGFTEYTNTLIDNGWYQEVMGEDEESEDLDIKAESQRRRIEELKRQRDQMFSTSPVQGALNGGME